MEFPDWFKLKKNTIQGVMINVSKTGNIKSFSKTQFMVHRTSA